MKRRVAVIGAGVSGLTTAIVLSEAGHEVTIVAKELDDTTSHAAAAIWLPYHVESDFLDAWALETRDTFIALLGEDAGISMIDFDVLGSDPPRCVARECVAIEGGYRVNVPLIDTTRYLPYLRRRFRGSIVQREIARSSGGQALLPVPLDLGKQDRQECLSSTFEVIVNCAGFGARTLFDDHSLEPGYGIAVVTDRPPIERAIVADEPLMYVIPRAADCILGGYDSPVPPGESEVAAIVARCRAAVPEVSGTMRAVRHGIRPVRPSVRLEAEDFGGRTLIHNYGHGGAGFTVSWGCAREVGRWVERTREGQAGVPVLHPNALPS